MDVRIPTLRTKIMLESNPLKSIMLARGLAVATLAQGWVRRRQPWAERLTRGLLTAPGAPDSDNSNSNIVIIVQMINDESNNDNDNNSCNSRAERLARRPPAMPWRARLAPLLPRLTALRQGSTILHSTRLD